MSRFHFPFPEIILSNLTSLRSSDVHDGADYPNSLHGFISPTLQMKNQALIPNHSLYVSSSSPSSK